MRTQSFSSDLRKEKVPASSVPHMPQKSPQEYAQAGDVGLPHPLELCSLGKLGPAVYLWPAHFSCLLSNFHRALLIPILCRKTKALIKSLAQVFPVVSGGAGFGPQSHVLSTSLQWPIRSCSFSVPKHQYWTRCVSLVHPSLVCLRLPSQTHANSEVSVGF